MLVQGLIYAYLYPLYTAAGSQMVRAMKFSMLMGLLLFSVTTMANGAKIEVASMSTWLAVQTAFTSIQFGMFGLALWFVHRHDESL